MTLKKSEYLAKYGEEAYKREMERRCAWYIAHQEEERARGPKGAHERNRKGGKHYDKTKVYNRTGLQGKRQKIRAKHGAQYHPFKMIIAPESQIHHEWIPKTAEYRGLALVEKDPHQYGIIDVIQILDGKITLLAEEDVKNGKKKKDEIKL